MQIFADFIVIASKVHKQVRFLADLADSGQVVVELVRLDVLHDSLVLDLGPDKIHRLGGGCVPPLVGLDLLEGEPIPALYDRSHQLMVVT